jgi:hypothetical protein
MSDRYAVKGEGRTCGYSGSCVGLRASNSLGWSMTVDRTRIDEEPAS